MGLTRPGDTAYNTIWAEDGSVFLNQAINQGILHAFTTPYSGYLHMVPRLLATIATLLPLQWAAAIFGIGSALVVFAPGPIPLSGHRGAHRLAGVTPGPHCDVRRDTGRRFRD